MGAFVEMGVYLEIYGNWLESLLASLIYASLAFMLTININKTNKRGKYERK